MLKIMKKIWLNTKNNHKSLVRALLLSFIRSSIGITQLFAIIFTLRFIKDGGDLTKNLIILISLTLICIIGNYITSYFEQINVMKTSFLMSANKRIDVGNKLRKLPLGIFNNSSRTRLITTLTSTVSGMESGTAMIFVGIISGLFNSFVLFIFMMFYDYRIGLIVGLGMIIYLLVVNYQMHLSRKNAPKLQNAQNELSNATLNFIQGIKVIKSYSINNGDSRLKEAIENSKKENINLTTKSMPSQYLASITIAIFESLILLTAIFLFKYSFIDINEVIMLLIFSFMVYGSLNQAGSMLSMIGLLDVALSEVSDIEKEKELEINKDIKSPTNNNIKFNNVSFSYDDNEVLHDVSFEIKENSFTAIVGKSGSGKTTLCELIPRFRDVNKGSISIGNVNIKDMEYDDISKRISMVFQRVYLFEDSILNNIRFANPNATKEEVINACKKAQCHEFISKLKDGYNTILSEGGNSLSGGEKQRISIARAILKDAPIIILDEATASVDPENEREIKIAIEELVKNKTVIMIAHKLNTIKNADKIIVLDEGRIVESGTNDELIKLNGIYNEFVNTRMKAASFIIKN